MGEEFRISKVRRENRFEMKHEHYHDYYEFYYQLSGNRKFFLNDKIYRVNAGDMILIPKGEIHRTSYNREDDKNSFQERIALCFGDDTISNLKKEVGEETFLRGFKNRQLTVPVNRRAYLEELFERLLTEFKGMDEFSELLCKRYCEEIVMFVIRCQNYGEPEADLAEVGNKNMESAAQYISSHFQENITLTAMAEQNCMSSTYFSRQFKHATGFGFKEYLNAVRIRHACDLLLSTEKSITEIAAECGYMDSNYFGDAFRKVKNLSPREYRKTNAV